MGDFYQNRFSLFIFSLWQDPRFTLEDCIELATILNKLSGNIGESELDALKDEVMDFKDVRLRKKMRMKIR